MKTSNKKLRKFNWIKLKVGCGAARWAGGAYGYTTAVVCHYAAAGNIIGGRGKAIDIGTPCTACKADCDPDYFGGVLCNWKFYQINVRNFMKETNFWENIVYMPRIWLQSCAVICEKISK